MCGSCGCGNKDEARLVNMQTGVAQPLDAHAYAHRHGIPHSHGEHEAHGHHGAPDHAHAGHHGPDHVHDHHHHAHDHVHDEAAAVMALEVRVLAKNDRLAARNRGWFEGRQVLAINLVSSPGAGKTTLLERTIAQLKGTVPISVIEGDQATANDGERIRAAGAPSIQVNTGAGCHLEADMVARGVDQLDPPAGSVLFIENVGNLVCPALFDLGERAKVVVLSVAEGEDKPLKYPHMFQAADLMIINKIDLLPHVDFSVETAAENGRSVNPKLAVLELSCRSGQGLEAWFDWIKARLGEAMGSATRATSMHA